jgi:DNA-binding NarL/FixJ family response regulator
VPSIDVAIADDHELVRDALTACVEATGRMRVVAGVGTGRAAVELVLAGDPPDVLLVDLGLPDLDGLDVVRRLVAAGSPTRAIVVSGRISADLVRTALDAGALGYVSKVSSVDLLPRAIDAVHAGSRFVDPEVAPHLAPDVREVLDPRELHVLEHLTAGRDDPTIAARLRIDEQELAACIDSLLHKLGCETRGAAVSCANLQAVAE